MPIRVNRAYLSATCAGMLAALLGDAPLAQVATPEVGTWRMNLATSTLNPGPPYQSANARFEVVGTGGKSIVDIVQADGSLIHDEYAAKYDGKDNPVTGNNMIVDMAAPRRINATTTQTSYRTCWKMATLTLTVSADGKRETTL